MIDVRQGRALLLFLLAAAAAMFASPTFAGQAAFETTVKASRPIAFYQLGRPDGSNLVGAGQYHVKGGVDYFASNGPFAGAPSAYAQLNGHDGYVLTTLAGGVNGVASMMAWVNLDKLPSMEGHFYYVMGESQVGNDLDVQFETDDTLKFYTAAGGHLSFQPPRGVMMDQWHMILVTLDTATQTRVIYWDGHAVAQDKGGGEPQKSGVFSIGASTVFGGRFMFGGVTGVAVWNRALKPSEVAGIYAAAHRPPEDR